MKFKIVTDSSSDLLSIAGAELASVPLKIITDQKEYTDNARLDVNTMIGELRKYKGRSGTSCPNTDDWKSAFEGSDRIFCVTITSGLSGSFNSAKIAMEEYLAENPEATGYVIDTLSVGPESALIIEKLAGLINEGLDFESIKEKIDEYRCNTHLIFSLDSLRNLANNGRVSPAVAKMAGILGIRIVGVASSEGTLEITDKVRGAEKSRDKIVENMMALGYHGGRVHIHHCQNTDAAVYLSKAIRKAFPSAKITERKTRGLCSFYAESGGVLIGFEGNKK